MFHTDPHLMLMHVGSDGIEEERVPLDAGEESH